MIRNPKSYAVVFAIILTAFLSPASHAGSPAPAWFALLDMDASGAITLVELHRARWKRFARRDVDQDGYLDRAEIAASSTWLKHFGWYDDSRDNRISIAEFEAKGRERFVIMDLNADGRVTLKELQTLSKAQSSSNGTASAGWRAGADCSATTFSSALAKTAELNYPASAV